MHGASHSSRLLRVQTHDRHQPCTGRAGIKEGLCKRDRGACGPNREPAGDGCRRVYRLPAFDVEVRSCPPCGCNRWSRLLMIDLPVVLPPTDWARLSLVYVHLLSCAFALVLVLGADWRVATGSFTIDLLRRTAHWTTFVLAALWLTGLALVYLDTGMDPEVLVTMPKLLLKLITVTMLTANGVVLHFISFPLIARTGRLTLLQSLALAITGALSTSHWLLAAFVGVARPLEQWPFETLMSGYVIYCLATLCVAVLSTTEIRRRLSSRSGKTRASDSEPCADSVDVLLLPVTTLR